MDSDEMPRAARTRRRWAFWLGLLVIAGGIWEFWPIAFLPNYLPNPHLPGHGPAWFTKPVSDVRAALALLGAFVAIGGCVAVIWGRMGYSLFVGGRRGLFGYLVSGVVLLPLLFATMMSGIACVSLVVQLFRWTHDEMARALLVGQLVLAAGGSLYITIALVAGALALIKRKNAAANERLTRPSNAEPQTASSRVAQLLSNLLLFSWWMGLAAIILALSVLGLALTLVPMSAHLTNLLVAVSDKLISSFDAVPALLGGGGILIGAFQLVHMTRTRKAEPFARSGILLGMVMFAGLVIYGVAAMVAPTMPDPARGLVYQVPDRHSGFYVSAPVAAALWVTVGAFALLMALGFFVLARRRLGTVR